MGFGTRLLILLLGILWDLMRDELNLLSSALKSTGLQLPYPSLGCSQCWLSYWLLILLQFPATISLSSVFWHGQLKVLISSFGLCQQFPSGSTVASGILWIKHILSSTLSFMNNIGLAPHFLAIVIIDSRFHIENCLSLYWVFLVLYFHFFPFDYQSKSMVLVDFNYLACSLCSLVVHSSVLCLSFLFLL